MTTSRRSLSGSLPEETKQATEHQPLRAAFVVQLVTVGIGYLIYAMNRSAFPIGLSSLGKTLGFSTFEVGTLATIFLLGQAVIDVPAGIWNSARGRTGLTMRTNRLMVTGTIGIGVTSVLLAYLAINFPLALTFRVLFGVFEGIFNICVYTFSGSALPKRRAFLNTVMGFFYAGGSIIGPTAYSQIIAGSDPNTGWRIGLVVFGGVSVVVAVLMFVTMAITIRRTQVVQPKRSADDEHYSTRSALREVVRRGSMWRGLIIHAVNLISYWEFSGLVPTFLIEYQHKSVAFVGFLFGTGFGLTSLASPLIGLAADRFGRRIVVSLLGVVDAVGLYLLLFSPTGQTLTFVFVFVIGIGLNTLYFTGYTLAQDGVPNNRVALATGLAGAVGYLIASTSGPISGWLTGLSGYRLAGVVELIAPQIAVAVLALIFLPGIKVWQQQRAAQAEQAGG